MESQEQSQFFSLPFEVLQGVYACLVPNAIHVLLRQGKLAISTCIEPDISGDLVGLERMTTGSKEHDTIWGRRLRSSWGPHWQCEEVTQRTAGYHNYQASCDFNHSETILALLLVCKKMRTHILNVTASSATFHVTDLETLNYLAQSHFELGLSPSPYEPLHAIYSLLKKLSITLRLPLSFFEAVSSNTTISSPSGNTQMPDSSVAIEQTTNVRGPCQPGVWRRVWPALAVQLRRLQSLQLWLDHDKQSSWSFIDERAILSLFVTFMSRDKIPSLEDISISLPNLHPQHEKPERHFTKESLQLPAHVTLSRRVRQRYFYEESVSGNIRVSYEADFPVMLELLDFEVPPGCERMTREWLENWERELWESGENPADVLMDMAGP